MGTRKRYYSLGAKITVGLLIPLVVVMAGTSYLRYLSYRSALVQSLGFAGAITSEAAQNYIDAQLTAYMYSRLLISVGSVIVIVVTTQLMMSRLVTNRLRQFLNVVKRIRPGEFGARVEVGSHDEIGELAEAFNQMADGLKEKEGLEQKVKERTEELQRQAEKLAALNTLATTVSQSLNLKEVLHSALDEVLALMRLRAGWIVLRDGQGEGLQLMASRGLPETVALAHRQCAWDRSSCLHVLAVGRPEAAQLAPEPSCAVAKHFQKEGLVFRACVPLKSREHILGVMSLIGDASSKVQELTEDTLETLAAIGRQIGIAVENASLYEELHQKEALRGQLLERVITAQEEERRRIARELHDQTGQSLTSLIMTLKVLEEVNSPQQARAHIGELRDMVVQILKGVRDLALQLRPSVLDDLGLLAALRHYLRGYEDRFRLPVDFQLLGLDRERLAPEVETALYRIVQEALTNVARHAQAHSVSVLLERRGASVKLIVEDDGQGFDVTQVMGSGPHEKNLGLYGMRERASLLGGTLTVESTPGAGTTVFVEIPLRRRETNHEKAPVVSD